MFVGLIIYGDLSITSGGYLYDRQLVSYLRSQGDTVKIFTLPWRSYAVHLLDNLHRGLLQRIKQQPLQILLEDELNHPSLLRLNQQLQARLSIPVISIVHHLRSSERHPAWQVPLYHRVERRYLQSVDGFIFNSQTTQAAVKALSSENKPSIIALPAGSHVSSTLTDAAITERAAQSGPLRLLFVGNVTPRKSLHVLLSALSMIPLNIWRLDVVGDLEIDRRYSREQQKSAAAQGLSGNITWHGRLSDPNLQERMDQSHVLVLPSSYEGFGIVYLEGMHFGLPAIGTTAGAAHEIITDGRNGYLINPDDAPALARKIQNLHDDRQLLARMGSAALEKAQSHPTWEMSMGRVREFLLERINQVSALTTSEVV